MLYRNLTRLKVVPRTFNLQTKEMSIQYRLGEKKGGGVFCNIMLLFL